jgi:hypothetical protein
MIVRRLCRDSGGASLIMNADAVGIITLIIAVVEAA